jgi:hypothetical protein
MADLLDAHPAVSSLRGVRFLSSPLAKISWRKGTYLTVGLAQFVCLSCWSLGSFLKGEEGEEGGVAKPVLAFKTTLLAYDCESYFAIVCGTVWADL